MPTKLKLGYVPWASVTVNGARRSDAVEQFVGDFERSVCGHFSSVTVRRPWLRRTAAVVLLLRADSACAALKRSSATWDDWKLLVGEGSPFLLDWVLGRGMNPKAIDLRRTCREIHVLLTGMPSVHRVYWYARGFRQQTAAVWTPDELPWSE